MVAMETYLKAGYVTLNLMIVYFMLQEVYLYLALLVLLYAIYMYTQKPNEERVQCEKAGVLITGCDTGFGHHSAIKLSQLGFTVFAGCLNAKGEGAKSLNRHDNIHAVQLDITKDGDVESAVKSVKDKCLNTGLWAVVNNAAINQLGDVELVSLEVMKQVAEVNYFGMVRVTKAFLPLLKKSKGRVVNVTSVRGRVALPTDTSYTPTKWAGEAFSDILRREMYRFGVKVVIIEPGNFGGATGMLNEENIKRNERMLTENWERIPKDVQRSYGRDYLDRLLASLRDLGTTTASSLDPVVDRLVDAVCNVEPKHRYLIHGGSRWLDWYCVMAFLNPYLPERWMDWIIRNTDPLPKVAQGVV